MPKVSLRGINHDSYKHTLMILTHTHTDTDTHTHTRTHTFCCEMNGDKSAGTIVLDCNTSRKCISAFQS